jgi:large subunit ribosomal protein L24
MRIKKGDLVKKIAGKDRGKQGKVLRVIPAAGKIVVEKINMMKKHVRPKRDGEKGQRVEIAAAFDASNAMVVCPECGKSTRVAYRVSKEKKVRICKKCNKEI